MQLNPEKIAYLVLGMRKKLGLLAEPQIMQLGESIADRSQPFDTVEHFKARWRQENPHSLRPENGREKSGLFQLKRVLLSISAKPHPARVLWLA